MSEFRKKIIEYGKQATHFHLITKGVVHPKRLMCELRFQEATCTYVPSALVSSSAMLSANDGNISIRDGMDKPLLRLQ